MSNHPKCKKCSGLLLHQPATSVSPERVVCPLCGWNVLRPPAVVPVPVEMKGKIVREPLLPPNDGRPAPVKVNNGKNYRGFCRICHRPDVLLTCKNGECCRCYKRIKNGLDPLTGAAPLPLASVGTFLVFTDDDAQVITRFESLSATTGGNASSDICTILDLYMDKKLMLREAAR